MSLIESKLHPEAAMYRHVIPAGEPFPTGHLRPPAHPGCRCLLVPPPDDP